MVGGIPPSHPLEEGEADLTGTLVFGVKTASSPLADTCEPGGHREEEKGPGTGRLGATGSKGDKQSIQHSITLFL